MTRDESNDEVLGALDATRWLFSIAYFILRDKKDALGAVYQAFARIGLVAQAQRKKEQKTRKVEARQKISLDRLQGMYAGASRVLVSQWRVADDATAELMARMYSGILGPRKLRPLAALREAQISMWKDKRWSFPYYWAGFVMQGEWR